MTAKQGRGAALAAGCAAVAVLAAGCGIGSTPDSKVGKTADQYLRALAAGDEAKACAQLTAEARGRIGTSCAAAMDKIEARLGSAKLERAANGGISIETTGQTGRASVHVLHAMLRFEKDGFTWLITDGFALSS